MSWGELPSSINMIFALIALLDPNLNWVTCGSSARYQPTDPFHSGRDIGSCEGDVVNITVNYLWSPVIQEDLSHLYHIAQQKTFFYGIGVLILCQFINALSLDRVVTKLGIYRISSVQRSTMNKAMGRIREDVHEALKTMRYDSFLADADWEAVMKNVFIHFYPLFSHFQAHLSNPYTEYEVPLEQAHTMNRDRFRSRKLR